MYIMVWFFAALLSALLSAMLAEKMGYSYWLFFILGLFLGVPVFLVLLVIYLIKRAGDKADLRKRRQG